MDTSSTLVAATRFSNQLNLYDLGLPFVRPPGASCTPHQPHDETLHLPSLSSAFTGDTKMASTQRHDHDAPACNILSYAFSDQQPRQWSSATDPSRSITTAAARLLIHRLGSGFDRMRIPRQATVMFVGSTDNMYTPILYLAVVGSQRIFTAADPASSTSKLVDQMKALEPSLILVDPAALEKVLEAVGSTGIHKDRVFSFDSDEDILATLLSVHDVYDWKILMARPTDGRKWLWDPLNDSAARKTIADIDVSSGTEAIRRSHYDVLNDALRIMQSQAPDQPQLESWLAVLPWNQGLRASRESQSNDSKAPRVKL